jgi:hypothetical protein
MENLSCTKPTFHSRLFAIILVLSITGLCNIALSHRALTSPTSAASASHHLLFSERVELLLPKKAFLFVDDIERVEKAILKFHIPIPVQVDVNEEWIPKEWQLGVEWFCPSNCTLTLSRSPDPKANAVVRSGCPRAAPVRHPGQLVICSCGEARGGTGAAYWRSGRPFCNISATQYANESMWNTYAHFLDAPPHWNIRTFTQLFQHYLRAPHNTTSRNPMAPLYFLHNNCGGARAALIKELLAEGLVHAGGSCFRNAQAPFRGPPKDWYWNDSQNDGQAHKTEMASQYSVLSALENTVEADYFTEKRFQALLAHSIPLVWSNDNSAAVLPHSSAAIFADRYSAKELASLLRRLHNNHTEFSRYFAWQRNGLSRDFVRYVFHGSTLYGCRACELAASQRVQY